ncbi:MAG: TonB-dependent receptor, partial [Bacteroidales bacterium]|nr:TonB-dependent receptor [Bacteroidales bacterium]
IYTDNPYWTRYENYQDDTRNRVLGYVSADYKIADWLSLSLRSSLDFYQDIQNERTAEGSNAQSFFGLYNRNMTENNTDLMLRAHKVFGDFTVSGLVAGNYRTRSIQSQYSTTVGGLIVPGLYSVGNSIAPVSISDQYYSLAERSAYANVTIDYQSFIYLEGTARIDQSSTLLPAVETSDYTFFYPSITLSVLLNELGGLEDVSWLDLAKVRANYAKVGAGTGFYRKTATYSQGTNWGSMALFSQPSTLQNPNLLPESTNSIEVGFEGSFFQNRLGIDLSLYKTNSYNQIFDVPVSNASGYNRMYINGGEIENKGIEVALYTTPIRTNDFSWNLNVNWYANRNMVVSLAEGTPTLQLMSAWDVKIHASEGEPYGTIKGTDYIYTDGKTTVGDDGYLLIGDDPLAIIGNINPDWMAGITNTFKYKAVSVSALIDIQKGGDIYSVGNKYGYATGVYAETAGNNPKGNPKRDAVADGGGMIFEDAVYADGTPNDTYLPAGAWGGYWYYGSTYSPTARYVTDATYVKLREVALTYSLPSTLLGDSFIRGIDVSLVGRNLWIIYKNTVHFDPEAILTSGNGQGIESGAYPAVRTFGVNLKLNF